MACGTLHPMPYDVICISKYIRNILEKASRASYIKGLEECLKIII